MTIISRSKDNQTMNFGQLIENIIRKIFFFKNYAEHEAERLVPEFLLFLKKALSEENASDLQLIFNILR